MNRGVLKTQAAEYCSLVYLERALHAEKDGAASTEYVQKLEWMCSTSDLPKGMISIVKTNSAAFHLGVWYHHINRYNQCQQFLRPRVTRCLDILSDDDPSNDFQAFYVLGHVLLAAGDTAKAKASVLACRGPDWVIENGAKESLKCDGEHPRISNIPNTVQTTTASQPARM